MRLVIDSNVLISAYTADGKIREHWRPGLGTHCLFISPEILTEVEKALRHVAFGLKNAEIKAILLDILDRCELVRSKTKYKGEIADETDRHLVNLAVEVGADYIVSGDHALQHMDKISGIPVLSPGEFFSRDA